MDELWKGKKPGLARYILFAFGLLLIAVALKGTVENVRFLSSAARTKGVVAGFVGIGESKGGGVIYAPQLTFSTENGAVVTVVARGASYNIGDPVNVLYDRDRPEGAKVDSFWQLWMNELALFCLGLLFTLTVLWAWMLSRRTVN